MKIEICDSTFWATIIVTAIIALSLTCGYICAKENETFQANVKAGLVQQQNVGSQGYIWVKP